MAYSIARRACGARPNIEPTRPGVRAVASSESELIERYFRDLGAARSDVALGIGDDAALVQVPPGAQLVLTTDALVEGVHFLPGAPAHSLGHRALAINLSDIAAMGASPAWALLALNLPAADDAWLQEFALGFGALARLHAVALVGGNLSRGALSITVALAGVVPCGEALRRDGAGSGDELYVSGSIGDAAGGLAWLRGELAPPAGAAPYLRQRFEYPTPRVALGVALRGIASACIDVSDGLHTDALRLLRAAGLGARIEVAQLPLSPALRAAYGSEAWRAALAGGEDYELCFTVPRARAEALAAAADAAGCTVTRIGTLARGAGITLYSANSLIQFSPSGFDHFRA
jgi:thiamine-monophosphate kinase